MSPEKNPLGFVELAERLAPEHQQLRFYLCGEGENAEEVRTRIAQSAIRHRIHFDGYVDDVRDALGRIDVLVVPSKFDGRPNIIMEANAMGRPVIAAPVGGIPEMIEDGLNGYLAASTDVDRISAMVARWEADARALDAQMTSAREIALKRFDRRRMVDEYERAYRSFLSE